MSTTSIYAPGFTERLYVEHCCSCGVAFGMPNGMQAQRRRDKKNFYCPNGHPQAYIESTEQQLRRQLENAQDAMARTREQLAHEAASLRATKGHLTRAKRRIAAGVCPYCNRNFPALGEHVRNEHPEEVPERLS